MKKLLLALLTAALLHSGADAGYFDDKGLISGWKFAPLQVDAGLTENKKLFDENCDTFLSVGLLLLQQKSAVISFAVVANTLQNNYGLQLPSLILGCAADTNYGISLGWDNFTKKCYGIQMGFLNHSWAGEEVAEDRERLQVLGINIADTVYVGLMNASDKFQIGLLNLSQGADFQIGLLNYNPKSYVPWMPLINFNMGKEK